MQNARKIAAECRQFLIRKDLADKWKGKNLSIDYDRLAEEIVGFLDENGKDDLESIVNNVIRDYPAVKSLKTNQRVQQELYIYLEKLALKKFSSLPSGVAILDIVQEALVKIVNKHDTFRFRSRFRTWCTTILIRTGFEMIRKEQKRMQREGTSIDAPIGESGRTKIDITPSDAKDPESKLLEKDVANDLIALIDLSLERSKNRERDRKIILDRSSGRHGEEIALELGINRSTVDMVMNRFKNRLKELVSQKHDKV